MGLFYDVDINTNSNNINFHTHKQFSAGIKISLFYSEGYSEIRRTLFSTNSLILLYIQKELSYMYTNLTSTKFLQEQSSFDKIGRSLHFLNFWCPGIRNYSTVFNGEVSFMLSRIYHQRKIIVNWNFEHRPKLFKWISIDGCHRKRQLESPRNCFEYRGFEDEAPDSDCIGLCKLLRSTKSVALF